MNNDEILTILNVLKDLRSSNQFLNLDDNIKFINPERLKTDILVEKKIQKLIKQIKIW